MREPSVLWALPAPGEISKARVVSLGRPLDSNGVEVRGSGNRLASFCPEKLWDSQPEHKGVCGENSVGFYLLIATVGIK